MKIKRYPSFEINYQLLHKILALVKKYKIFFEFFLTDILICIRFSYFEECKYYITSVYTEQIILIIHI